MRRKMMILIGIVVAGILGYRIFRTPEPKFIQPIRPEVVFESVYNFSNGLAYVKLNGRIGFIDTRGQWAVSPRFEETDLSFSEGLVWARQGKLFGFIDTQGRWVIPPQFKNAKQFTNGLAAVVNNKGMWGYVDKTGKFVIPAIAYRENGFSEGYVTLEIEDKTSKKPRYCHALFDANGNIVFSKKQYELGWEISEGLVRFRIWPVFSDDRVNFGERLGCVPGMPKVNMIGPGMMGPPGMFGGLGTSLPASMPWNSVRWGFIDMKGDVVIEPQFEWVGKFLEGLAKVQLNQKWGYIDRTGKMVIKPQWSHAGDFKNGFAWVSQGMKYGVIDKTGKLISPMQWNNSVEFRGELALVKSGDKMGFIDRTGKVVISPKFDDITSTSKAWFSDGPVPVCVKNKWGYIDRTGKYVIEPRFDYARHFSDGLAVVEMGRAYRKKVNRNFLSEMFDTPCDCGHGKLLRTISIEGKYGFIDKTGRVVIEPQFDSVNEFKEGFAVVRSGSDSWFIDKTGKPLKVSLPMGSR